MIHNPLKIYVDVRALIFVSVLIYFAPLVFSAAYFFAVFFHELGHLLFLVLFKKQIYAIHLELKGLVIEHEGNLTYGEAFFCSAAGPALSFGYAFFSAWLSAYKFTDFLQLSAGFSLALGFFNSLPVVPLDGSVMLRAICDFFIIGYTEEILLATSCAVCTVLLMLGIYLLRYNMGYGLIVSALLLILCTLFEEGIVKRTDLR